ncbi:MAG: hypothetical protein OEX00_06895, partial [Gammaproteobacteria bacterium]|nr:hypothetical protein [Gammaproteobacteria bacterium]
QSYHVIPNSLNIDYVLKNFGPESVVEKNIFRVFYNSDEGYPIHWDLVTPSKFKILSAEGEETVSAKTLYQGQVESITVVTGFKSSTGTASVFPDSAGSSIDPPADSEIMLKERLDQHTLHLITLENQ